MSFVEQLERLDPRHRRIWDYSRSAAAVGFWEGEDDIRKNWAEDKRWEPQMAEDERQALFDRWKEAVQRTLGWVKE